MRHVLSTGLVSSLVLCATASTQVRCPIEPYGQTCGARFSASVALDGKDRIITLMLDNAKSLAFGVMVFGPRSIRVPLPNSACDLLVDPAGVVPFATDFGGRSRRMLRVPYGMTNIDAYLQDITFSWDQSQRLVFDSANGLRVGPWADVREVAETFQASTADPELSGAGWGGGKVVPGQLGGSGVLGEFRASDGTMAGQDARGRTIYVWDTDGLDIPAARTMTGKLITVTNGVLEFASFVVASNEAVRFIGSHPPRIFATGEIRIEGAVELFVETPPLFATNVDAGAPGGRAGSGGAPGGQGGDTPRLANYAIDGRHGGDALVPQGHPRAGQALGTGGRGSLGHPQSALARDVVWVDAGRAWSRMIAAGGAGGGLITQGEAGLTARVPGNLIWPYSATGAEFGPASLPGLAFPVLPLVPTLASIDQFLIGGAGGGGGGMHPMHSSSTTVTWSAGAGGAGGGGALLLRAGGDLTVATAAQVLVNGGTTHSPSNQFHPPAPAPGGAGSGGSVLGQAGRSASVLGEVSVLGGTSGEFLDNMVTHVRSTGGAGGDGYLRIEANPRPDHTTMTKTLPRATADNTGALRPIDEDLATAAASRWTSVGFVPTAWHYYVIEANVDGNKVTYSDNPLIAARPAAEGEAVVFHLQSATLDANGNPVGDPTPWAQGRIDPVNDSANKGNGFRFFLRLDRNQTRSGRGNVDVVSVRVIVNC